MRKIFLSIALMCTLTISYSQKINYQVFNYCMNDGFVTKFDTVNAKMTVTVYSHKQFDSAKISKMSNKLKNVDYFEFRWIPKSLAYEYRFKADTSGSLINEYFRVEDEENPIFKEIGVKAPLIATVPYYVYITLDDFKLDTLIVEKNTISFSYRFTEKQLKRMKELNGGSSFASIEARDVRMRYNN